MVLVRGVMDTLSPKGAQNRYCNCVGDLYVGGSDVCLSFVGSYIESVDGGWFICLSLDCSFVESLHPRRKILPCYLLPEKLIGELKI